MKKNLILGLLLVIGCGGSGGSGGTTLPNPFQGTWDGTFKVRGSSQTGSFIIGIAGSGVTAGTVHDNQSGLDGDIGGIISSDGTFSGTVDYPGQSSTLKGKLTKTGKLASGTLVQTSGGVTIVLDTKITQR